MSNNTNQPDKTGGYRDKVSKKSEADSYSNESYKENDVNLHLGSKLLSGRGTGILPSLIILMIFIGVFVFVLPNLDAFNHVVRPTDYVSGADIPDYIRKGASSEDVIALQRALFKLGVVTIDDITGVYDEKSAGAVNKLLRENSMETGEHCSLQSYRFILDLAEGKISVSQTDKTAEDSPDKDKPEENKDKDKDKDGNTENTEKTTTTKPTEKTTEKTTASTKKDGEEEDGEEEEKQKVRITEEKVRLYAKMRRSSTILFYVEEGDEYELIETAEDDDGNTWYKIQYKDICTGWVLGDKAEVISAQEE